MNRGPPPLYRFVAERSGQSNTLAVVLLLGITITGTGTIVAFGATALEATQSEADIGQAEQAMTQLDSRASLIAHGSSNVQRASIDTQSGAGLQVTDGGQITIEKLNETTGVVEATILNASMGAVVYERSGTTVAYEGGGVWRKPPRSNGSVMISPPEAGYESGTLTLPLVLVRGEADSGDLTLRQAGPSTGYYPNSSVSPARTNPLDEGKVNVTVTSEYYRAWGSYFAERTAGNVSYNDPNQTVEIELVVPFDEEFDDAVVSTGTSPGITVNGNSSLPSPSEQGVAYPLVDSRIENAISTCGGCPTFSAGDTLAPSSDRTYIRNGDFDGGLTVDTTGGDVTLVVDGNAKFKNTISVSGSNNVTVLVREDLDLSDEVNHPSTGNAEQFRTLVHSDGEVDGNGNYKYVGLLYAPGSDVDLNGGGSLSPNVEGGVIGEQVTLNGNPNDFQYDPAIENIDLGLGAGGPRILYLHVSTTEVEIED